MTTQFSTIIKYKDLDYIICGYRGKGMFDPNQYGIDTISWCTGCWDGFLGMYKIENNKLFLDNLEISLNSKLLENCSNGFIYDVYQQKVKNEEPSISQQQIIDHKEIKAPKIKGRMPIKNINNPFFEYRYENIQLPICFSGSLLIAYDQVELYLGHMGICPAWKFYKVYELILKKGEIISKSNRSFLMLKMRQQKKNIKIEEITNQKDEKRFLRRYNIL